MLLYCRSTLLRGRRVFMVRRARRALSCRPVLEGGRRSLCGIAVLLSVSAQSLGLCATTARRGRVLYASLACFWWGRQAVVRAGGCDRVGSGWGSAVTVWPPGGLLPAVSVSFTASGRHVCLPRVLLHDRSSVSTCFCGVRGCRVCPVAGAHSRPVAGGGGVGGHCVAAGGPCPWPVSAFVWCL